MRFTRHKVTHFHIRTASYSKLTYGHPIFWRSHVQQMLYIMVSLAHGLDITHRKTEHGHMFSNTLTSTNGAKAMRATSCDAQIPEI